MFPANSRTIRGHNLEILIWLLAHNIAPGGETTRQSITIEQTFALNLLDEITADYADFTDEERSKQTRQEPAPNCSYLRNPRLKSGP
jgi:hypothetical protein